jgi:hypothetical protein
MKRATLAMGTALAAMSVAIATPATAQVVTPGVTTTSAKPLKPLYGNVRSFYGNVRSFWGEVNPFYGNVRSFWGNVNPFYGNVRSFWGTMDPALMAVTAGAPAYAGVGTFWETTGAKWESIAGRWQAAGAYDSGGETTYRAIATDLQSLVASSKTFWGPCSRVSASILTIPLRSPAFRRTSRRTSSWIGMTG